MSRTNDAVFIELAGATIVSRGGRLYVRCRQREASSGLGADRQPEKAYAGRDGSERREDVGYEEIGAGVHAIVGSGHGFVITSDAMQVCAKRHVEVIITDATQSFLAICASHAPGNASRSGMAARMRQFAALADPQRKLTIAKDIVRRKVMAERHEPGIRLVFLDGLETCKTVAAVRHVEAKSAQEWWRRWKNFELHFAKGFNPPRQWRSFKTRYIGRAQGKSGELPRQFTARFAETPLQALHNFAVGIAVARLTRVIAARGLDPCFGFLHDGRKPGRYSLAWDAIEVLRPTIAVAIFQYAGDREFERGEFLSQDGVVRLSSHVAKECETLVLKTISVTMMVQEVGRIEKLL